MWCSVWAVNTAQTEYQKLFVDDGQNQERRVAKLFRLYGVLCFQYYRNFFENERIGYELNSGSFLASIFAAILQRLEVLRQQLIMADR